MTKHVGTTDEVIDAFLAGEALRTGLAPVPGGCRSYADEAGNLFSYRTIVAVRKPAERGFAMYFALTPRKYTVTTSKLVGQVARRLRRAGYHATEQHVTVSTAVPGRWGGFGPAWHSTGYESLPFVIWSDE